MIFRKQTIYVGMSLLALIFAACTPQGPAVPVTGETAAPTASPIVPPQAILAAQQWLAAQLSVAAEQVQIIEVEQSEWTDSCLGLGRPNESCLQAVTPGWRAVFEINGQRYEVRTDETGSVVRLASPEELPSLPPQAILEAQQWLATQLAVAVEQVQVLEVAQAEWNDSCLGLGRPDESCLQLITPGWQAVFQINGQRYEVRTDETGSVIRLASPTGIPGPAGGETGMENTQWSLVSFGEEPLISGSEITLLLAAGQAAGSGGCNSYGGSYRVAGQKISFESITSTKRACADSQATEEEQRYFQALEAANEYFVEGNQLRITYNDGQGVLIFESTLPR